MIRLDVDDVRALMKVARVSGLRRWRVLRWESGLRIELDVGSVIRLDLRDRDGHPAYATTSSLALAVRSDVPLNPGTSAVVNQVADRLRAADPGDWQVAVGEAIRVQGDDAIPDTKHPERHEDVFQAWLRSAEGLQGRLSVAAGLAWQAHLRGEVYPFPSLTVSGDPMHAWVVEAFPASLERTALEARWGTGALPRLLALVAPLREVGVAVLGEDRVDFFAGAPADVAIWRVFLWDPAVRDAAAGAWGTGPTDARTRLIGALDAA